MAIPGSGPISLTGTIQGEFGGTTPTSMSEYLRGGGNGYVPDTTTNAAIPSSAVNMSFSKFYGTAKLLDTQSLYVGYATSSYTSEGTTFYRYTWGYRQDVVVPTGGSVSDGTSNIYSGATIRAIVVDWDVTGVVQFRVNGTQPNSGWTTMTLNGTTYNRADAAYTAGGVYTNWQWEFFSGLGPLDGYVNSTVTVTWN